MSSQTYAELFRECVADLLILLDFEKPQDPNQLPTSVAELPLIYEYYAILYIKYLNCYKKLEECDDQMVHPQKRLIVRKLLEATMGRVVEIKAFLTSLDLSDFPNIDDILLDLRMDPSSFEVPVPHYFVTDRYKELRERTALLKALLEQYQKEAGKDTAPTGVVGSMSKEQAIRIIQANERGRQGRLRAKFMKEIRAQEQRERHFLERGGSSALSRDDAAKKIQRIVRGWLTRARVHREMADELVFLGMVPAPRSATANPQARLTASSAKRRVVQRQHKEEYTEAIGVIRNRLRTQEGPLMKEELQDRIRQWFVDHREQYGKFPEYPAQADGGSASIFEPKPATPEEEAPPDDSKAGKKPQGGAKEEEVETVVISDSFHLQDLADGCKLFCDLWLTRDESGNFTQRYDAELLRDELRPEVLEEVRADVDEIMQEELKNLKLAVEKESKKKKKKGKAGKSKKKGGKVKKEKDLTPDRSIESLYAELASHGLVKVVPPTHISDFLGTHNVLTPTFKENSVDIDPSFLQIRRVLVESVLFPLGSQCVHESAPLTKGLLLYGPHGCGKRLLAQAIAHQTGANFFDLSPSATNGKYQSHVTLMIHIVFKLAKTLAPSVIFIGNAERVLANKVSVQPNEDKPNRIKKDLLKELKAIRSTHRVLIVGTSSAPWVGDVKTMLKVFQKQIFCPRPDYACRNYLWQELIKKAGGVLAPDFDLSTLTQVTEGFTAGTIVSVVTRILTPRRLAKLDLQPLTVPEILAPLARHSPVYVEEDNEFRKFMAKLPLEKQRRRRIQESEAEQEGTAAAKAKAKGPGKK